MKNVTSSRDIYPAVEELILLLEKQGHKKMSSILKHRMYVVSWTSASELHNELRSVLFDAISTSDIINEIKEQMTRIVAVIDNQSCSR